MSNIGVMNNSRYFSNYKVIIFLVDFVDNRVIIYVLSICGYDIIIILK